MYIKCQESDDNPVFGRIQSAVHGPSGRRGPWVCWLPATPAMVANEFWHARSMKSTASPRQLGRASCCNPITNPVSENGFKDRIVTFYVYRRNQQVEDIHNLLTAQT
ncbi:hypothetical protein Y032_0015g2657 [Ancylostoma ceylanicum]|uniref:Uncharacterized protein n=1 Tax=Ancylostoma ceylanicum TaxID=53326 RepID=A0A016V718_9BILA|nr:hypothetical protein Y032_0015g2657 [Ancylostoma ceylanicum]